MIILVYVCCVVLINVMISYITVSILHYQYGLHALHLAAFCGRLEMVKYLLPILGEKKFDVDSRGHTCLTLAIEQQKEDVVEYLLQQGGFTN